MRRNIVSDSPRTDASVKSLFIGGKYHDFASIDLCRQFERELAAAENLQRRMYEHYLFELERANAAESRLREAEKDAERYRWLRNATGPASRVMDGMFYGERLDEEIDAAREGEK
jgi:hypothetical protein